MSDECNSCVKLRQRVDHLEKKLHSALVQLWKVRAKAIGTAIPRVCREIRRRETAAPHLCWPNPPRALKKILKAEPCRPMTEVGVGALVLMRCEYIRLTALFDRTETCWPWRSPSKRFGYGQFGWDNDKWSAHRFIYTLYRGDIAYGMVLDHTCLNKACVNPDHLEVVTQGENVRRSIGLPLPEAVAG